LKRNPKHFGVILFKQFVLKNDDFVPDQMLQNVTEQEQNIKVLKIKYPSIQILTIAYSCNYINNVLYHNNDGETEHWIDKDGNFE
jgi:hypothetical protein